MLPPSTLLYDCLIFPLHSQKEKKGICLFPEDQAVGRLWGFLSSGQIPGSKDPAKDRVELSPPVRRQTVVVKKVH